jgi:hypothetical protein
MKSHLVALKQPKGLGEVLVRWPGRQMVAVMVATAAAGLGGDLYQAALGQVPQTLNGPPVQVQPYVPEPGVPLFTINPGTPNPFSGADGAGAGNGAGASSGGDGNGSGTGGSGTADATVGDYSSDPGGAGGSAVGNSTALGTMLGTSWGAAVVANAQALGVNPSALAATCVLESGCQNVGGSGTISGVFQMSDSTYTAALQAALQQNPSLAQYAVPGLSGKMDPATESIAAAEYLYQGAQALQGAGIDNPTVLQVRGYYNFGPTNGVNLATADDSATMVSVLRNLSSQTLTANGIAPGETVGQWRAQVSAKIGNAAGQSVLSS